MWRIVVIIGFTAQAGADGVTVDLTERYVSERACEAARHDIIRKLNPIKQDLSIRGWCVRWKPRDPSEHKD